MTTVDLNFSLVFRRGGGGLSQSCSTRVSKPSAAQQLHRTLKDQLFMFGLLLAFLWSMRSIMDIFGTCSLREHICA